MNATIWEIAGALVMSSGGFFVLVAAIGAVKLPDIYCRAHALGKAMTLGLILILIGYGLIVPEVSWGKIAAAVCFQLVTIPVASHLFCLIAYRQRVRRWSAKGWVDEVGARDSQV